MVKLGGCVTETVTVTEWDIGPLVPVTLMVYVPGAALLLVAFRNELPAPLEVSAIVVGLRVAIGPEGEMDADRLTVPE